MGSSRHWARGCRGRECARRISGCMYAGTMCMLALPRLRVINLSVCLVPDSIRMRSPANLDLLLRAPRVPVRPPRLLLAYLTRALLQPGPSREDAALPEFEFFAVLLTRISCPEFQCQARPLNLPEDPRRGGQAAVDCSAACIGDSLPTINSPLTYLSVHGDRLDTSQRAMLNAV